MYDTQSARSRNDKWNTLHHYRSHCVGDRHAGGPTAVGVLLPSYLATTVGQEHTLVSHQYDLGDESRDGLAAPDRRPRLKAEGLKGLKLKTQNPAFPPFHSTFHISHSLPLSRLSCLCCAFAWFAVQCLSHCTRIFRRNAQQC